MTAAIKAQRRCIAYYDVDSACVRKRIFSSLEIAHVNEVFGRIQDILSDIRGKYITVRKCQCSPQIHNITRFIIELNSNEIAIETIYVIKDVLEGLSVEFTSVVSRHEGRHTFIDLVFTQFT